MKTFQYICVLDFEATCEDIKYFDNEIIEFPSVLLKKEGDQYQPVAEFQKFCKPLVNPKVSQFCFDLTGITQEMVDAGENFPDVLKEHNKWLYENTGSDVIIVTCGYWDLNTALVSEAKKWAIVPPSTYRTFINIKKEFTDFYKNKSGGMAEMLTSLGIPLEGRHHSGIDDCRNIAKIYQRMVVDGYTLNETSLISVPADAYDVNPRKQKSIKLAEMKQMRYDHR